MTTQREYWDEYFKSKSSKEPMQDDWLIPYLSLLKSSNKIIDLGCGDGADTFFLCKQGIDLIACDFSAQALKRIKKRCPEIKTMCFDMEKGLPFEDNSIDIIISDLSLHYFNWEPTVNIVKEILRVNTPNGYLLGRVNSIKDINFGAMKGAEIERNYYYFNKCLKRFFNPNDIRNLFGEWEEIFLEEKSTNKCGVTKIVWEFCFKNKK